MLYRIFLVITLLFYKVSNCQSYFGLISSNYAGVFSVNTNPASIADSRFKSDFLFTGLNATFSNTLFKIKRDAFWGMSQEWINLVDIIKSSSSSSDWGKAYINQRDKLVTETNHFSDKTKTDIYVALDIQGPSFLIDINNTSAFAFTTRVRSMFNLYDNFGFSGIFQNLDKYMGNEIQIEESLTYPNLLSGFRVEHNTFFDMGFTYAREIYNREAHFVKAGITIKKVWGLNHLSTISNSSFLQISNIRTNPSVTIAGDVRSVFYGAYGFNFDPDKKFSDYLLDMLKSSNNVPSGWGVDLGFVYEHRKNYANIYLENNTMVYNINFLRKNIDHTKSKYDYKVSFALIDLGYVSYKSMNNLGDIGYSVNIKNPVTLVYKNPSYVLNIPSINKTDYVYEIKQSIEEFNVSNSSYNSSSTKSLYITPLFDKVDSALKPKNKYAPDVIVNLPTKIFASFDYRINDFFYASAIIISNINLSDYGPRVSNLVNITPRLETPLFDLGIPLTYNQNSKRLYYGLGVRLMDLRFGSDDIVALFGDSYGANFYLALGFSILKKKPVIRVYPKNESYRAVSYNNKLTKTRKINNKWNEDLSNQKLHNTILPNKPKFGLVPIKDGEVTIPSLYGIGTNKFDRVRVTKLVYSNKDANDTKIMKFDFSGSVKEKTTTQPIIYSDIINSETLFKRVKLLPSGRPDNTKIISKDKLIRNLEIPSVLNKAKSFNFYQ